MNSPPVSSLQDFAQQVVFSRHFILIEGQYYVADHPDFHCQSLQLTLLRLQFLAFRPCSSSRAA